VNARAEQLFGWSAEEVLGKRAPFIAAERAAAFETRHREAFDAVEIPAVEVTHRRKDGGDMLVNIQRAAVRDRDGRAVAMVGIMSDATADARARAERLRNETNFRALIERAPDAIFVHRLGFVIYANPRAATLLRYDSEESLVGVRIATIVHPDHHAAVAARVGQIMEKGEESAPLQERFVRRDGTLVDVEVIGLRVMFDGHMATLAHARDVTEHNQLLAKLRMADRLASVGRLAAGVGHEINNPLTYVICNLDAVDRTLDDVDAERARTLRELLADVRHGVDRVRSIARDLSVLSRAESDERGFVDVRRVLDVCGNMAAHEVKYRARLVKAYDDVPLVTSSEPRLAQIFLNLILNAAQAIPPGDVEGNTITLRARATEAHVIVEVTDTGSGIPAAIIDRVFDPFFTTKAIGAGTGLGLSICQGLIGALGGLITLESNGTRGTTARVMHPIAR
jgi:two-component system NtrC family sensor kinase